jgi:hypothetical protein
MSSILGTLVLCGFGLLLVLMAIYLLWREHR